MKLDNFDLKKNSRKSVLLDSGEDDPVGLHARARLAMSPTI